MLAGGGPLKTPFGTFYAPNITMDRLNGIGAWTMEQFSAALTWGVSPGGENYYPAFVYPNYTRLSDQDIVGSMGRVQDRAAGIKRSPRPRNRLSVQINAS